MTERTQTSPRLLPYAQEVFPIHHRCGQGVGSLVICNLSGCENEQTRPWLKVLSEIRMGQNNAKEIMSVRVIVVRKEKDIIQVFPASLVGERGDKRLVVTSDGTTREYPKDEVFGAAGLAERRIDELLENM